MTSAKVELRRLEMQDLDTPLLERPIVFSGPSASCEQYAADHGYRWKPDRSLLFGGYFANIEGNCLVPT